VTTYPRVRGELETLALVESGRSIARFGDGEFKVCMGGSAIAQSAHPVMAKRLKAILQDAGTCLVGLPNIYDVQARHTNPQKIQLWSSYQNMARLLGDQPFVSAFITRPDSAPWIDTPDYWARLEALWMGRDVTLVRGKPKSLTAADLGGARRITEIIAPERDAFADYDSLLRRVGTPERCLICLGPTATVMAVDLCANGVHAIDLGHVGMFLRKHRTGVPMVLSKDDKSYDKVPA
jgi:hypothetical protein